jgi:hypothetical protein
MPPAPSADVISYAPSLAPSVPSDVLEPRDTDEIDDVARRSVGREGLERRAVIDVTARYIDLAAVRRPGDTVEEIQKRRDPPCLPVHLDDGRVALVVAAQRMVRDAMRRPSLEMRGDEIQPAPR